MSLCIVHTLVYQISISYTCANDGCTGITVGLIWPSEPFIGIMTYKKEGIQHDSGWQLGKHLSRCKLSKFDLECLKGSKCSLTFLFIQRFISTIELHLKAG